MPARRRERRVGGRAPGALLRARRCAPLGPCPTRARRGRRVGAPARRSSTRRGCGSGSARRAPPPRRHACSSTSSSTSASTQLPPSPNANLARVAMVDAERLVGRLAADLLGPAGLERGTIADSALRKSMAAGIAAGTLRDPAEHRRPARCSGCPRADRRRDAVRAGRRPAGAGSTPSSGSSTATPAPPGSRALGGDQPRYDHDLDRLLRDQGFLGFRFEEGAGPLEAALVVEAVARAGGRRRGRRRRAGRARARSAGESVTTPGGGGASPGRRAPVRFAADATDARRRRRRRGGARRARATATPGRVATRFGYPMATIQRWDGRSAGPRLGGGRAGVVARRRRGRDLRRGSRAALDTTVAHVRERQQFGRPLGSFQALQHRLAECEVLIEGARWLALEAAWSWADPERAAAAAVQALRAGERTFWETHQFSGALGFAVEYDLHLWTMRLPALRAELLVDRPAGRCADRARAGRSDRAMTRRRAPRPVVQRRAGRVGRLRSRRRRPVAGRRRRAEPGCRTGCGRGWPSSACSGWPPPEGGGGAQEIAAVMEVLGEAAAPGPLVATFMATQLVGAARARPARRRRRRSRRSDRRRCCRGRRSPTCSSSWRPTAPGWPGRPVTSKRWRRSPASRGAAPGSSASLPSTRSARRRALVVGDVAVAAYLVGAAGHLVAITSQWLQDRVQFGRPIGEFQSLAHPLADVRDPHRGRPRARPASPRTPPTPDERDGAGRGGDGAAVGDAGGGRRHLPGPPVVRRARVHRRRPGRARSANGSAKCRCTRPARARRASSSLAATGI